MKMNSIDINKIDFKNYNPFTQFDDVKYIWNSLLDRCPHSYYLSWAWTEIWLNSLPLDCDLTFITGYIYESPVIAFFVGSRIEKFHRYFRFHKLALNQTLIDHIDTATYIEYNAILIDPEISIALESLLEIIPIKSWDEFQMMRCSIVDGSNLLVKGKNSTKYNINIEKCQSSYVDLEKIRQNNDDYLALLSQNRREQIRRSIKEYNKLGDIQIQIAKNPEDALIIFDELIELHQKRWTALGYAGALSTEYSLNFHKTLINRRFHHGEIQLIKISAGKFTIGCLYNFIHNKNILFITCGFNYLAGNLYRPGFVSHFYAIMHNAMIGMNRYDFLEGYNDYKVSLSSNQTEMENIIVQKNSFRLTLIGIAINLYRAFKRITMIGSST